MVPSATVIICACVLAVYSIDGEASRRWKRDVAGLVSFPRIGRGEQQWKSGLRDVGRQSLMSFPRTGKRDLTDKISEGEWFAVEPERKTTGKQVWAVVQMKDLPMMLVRPAAAKPAAEDYSEETG